MNEYHDFLSFLYRFHGVINHLIDRVKFQYQTQRKILKNLDAKLLRIRIWQHCLFIVLICNTKCAIDLF